MKIKGAYCLFFILSVWFSQAQALDLSYKSDIPVDNKPSEEYQKKRGSLEHENWNAEKLAKDNTLAEKREKEQREQQDQTMQHLREQTKRRCYRETRQKLEKEQGNGYSYADIADACAFY
ncbi:hypothetical protein [Xenorhabdus kozodoii]|nr:hypothetical protein [Xenorhabdus kozodoii]